MAEAAADTGEHRIGALLALWNDVDPAQEALYEHWHAQEHVPERLLVPGMRWGLRFRDVEASRAPRYLTLYALRDPAVLDSAPYQRLLREPTPTSARMRPALRHVSRWVCDIVDACALHDCAELLVWTAAEAAVEAQGGAQRWAQLLAGDAPRLLARRRDDAAALPWLGTAQKASTPAAADSVAVAAIDGEWLLAADAAALPATIVAPRRYRRLPVAEKMQRL